VEKITNTKPNSLKKHPILIEHINIRSLKKNFPKLNSHIVDKHPDVMCISETWNHVNNNGVSIEGYSLISRNRSNNLRGGGVAIYFKNCYEKVRHARVEKLHDDMEQIWATFTCKKIKFLVAVMYRPPKYDIKLFIQNLENSLKNLQKDINKLPTFILGDFNIDYKRKDQFLSFFELMEQFGFSQQINDATRETATSSTIIDLIFTNISSNLLSSGIYAENLSDHNVVYINYTIKKPKSTAITYRPTDNVDYLKFREALCYFLIKNSVPSSNFNYISTLQKCLESSLDYVCPEKTFYTKKPYAPWIKDPEIITAMSKRDKSRAAWLKDKSSIEKNKIYRSSVKTVDKLVIEKRTNYLDKISKTNDTKLLWNVIKRFQHKEVIKSHLNVEIFSKYYSEISYIVTSNVPDSDSDLCSFIDTAPNGGFSFQTVTNKDMLLSIDKLKRNKFGCNGISSNMIQSVWDIIITELTNAFNDSIKYNCYPDDLKKASIRPVPKNNNPYDVTHYRPICLQPTLAKVYEYCLNYQIQKFLKEHRVLFKNQFGFREKLSTEMLLHLINNKIKNNLHEGLLTIIIYLDFSKAFDTISHLTLIKKLSKIGFSKTSLLYLKSYLRKRFVFTKHQNNSSNPYEIKAGVPQGSILGPVLFNIYVSDFHLSIPPDAILYQFADDCQLLLSFHKNQHFDDIISRVNNILQITYTYSKDNNLCLNAQKTQILPIFNRNSVFSKMPFFEANTNFIKEAKSLGIYYNQKFNWNNHFKALNQIFMKTFHELRIFFRSYTNKSDLSLRRKIVNVLLLPKVCYNITLFYNASCSNKLYFNKWNRLIASLITQHYCTDADVQKCHLTSFDDIIKCRCLNFIKNPATHQLQIIQIHKKLQPFNSRTNSKNIITTNLPPTSFSSYISGLINSLSQSERHHMINMLFDA